MRVLWVHNFDPAVVSAGVFMHIQYRAIRSLGLDAELWYTGNLRRPANILRAAREVRKLSRQYDVVHAQFGSACALVAAFARCPKVVSLRGTDLFGADCGGLWWRCHGLACRRLTKLALSAYDEIIVMSDRMRHELQQAYRPRAPIGVLPSGVNLEQFQPLDRMEARRRLGEEGNTAPWVLFSSLPGTGKPIKRYDLAKAAFELARRQCPDAEFRLLTGQTHDRVPLWVNASDVVLLTSTREGWPNIVKEALACNVPFVSTDVSDLWKIAQAEPSCTVAEAAPEALAAGILNALGYQRPSTLRSHVEAMSDEAIAARLKDMYERLHG